MRCGGKLVCAYWLRSTTNFASSILSLVLRKSGMSGVAVPPQLTMGLRAPPHLHAPSQPRLCKPRLARWQSTIATATAAASTDSRPLSADSQKRSDAAEQMLHSSSTGAAQPSEAVRPPPGCQAPLCERPAQHTASADALRTWRTAAIAALDEVGDAHAAQGGGSTRDELKASSLPPRGGRCEPMLPARRRTVFYRIPHRLSAILLSWKLTSVERSVSWAGSLKTPSPLCVPTAAAAGGTRAGAASSCCLTTAQQPQRGVHAPERRRKCCCEHHFVSCGYACLPPIAHCAASHWRCLA